MPVTNRRRAEGRRVADRLLARAAAELRLARLEAGLTQVVVARLLAVSQMQVSRAERGQVRDIGLLIAFAAIVGREIRLSVYPGGPAVRDRAHASLMARLQAVTPLIRWQTEVALPIPGDRRAIDAVGTALNGKVGAELESRMADGQSVSRHAVLKQRDAGLPAMLLVLADTHYNRDGVRAASATVRAAFPLGARTVMDALRSGTVPPGNGILFL